MEPLPTLIVDDSKMIVKIVKKALLTNKLKGFEFKEEFIYTASDGMEAFEMMGKDYPIKLIITDVNMPNLNGNEFIEILQDTGKLESLEVVFITSASSNCFLSSSIKDNILGVIYKPFNSDKFVELLDELYEEKKETALKIKKIRELQVEKKKYVYKISTTYLEKYLDKSHFSLEDSETSTLNSLIDEIFGDEDISEDEYTEIIYSVLSTFMFEINISHTVISKNILCIIKNSKDVAKIQENRLIFIETFESQISYVNSTKGLELKEILKALTTPLLDAISIAFSNVKSSPKLNSKLFSPYFTFVIDELSEIDCLFVDDKLEKLLIEHKEVIEFTKWMHRFLYNNNLTKSVEVVSSSQPLKSEVLKRLNKAYQQAILISQHYCGELEFYIWTRAKESIEITNYLKKNMGKTIPSTYRYLMHKDRIRRDKLEEYIHLEKQNILVVSAELDTLKIFKDIIEAPLDKWNFFCYAKLSLLNVWMNSNIPNKIIIDYNFKGSSFENGIEFLILLVKKYPVFKKIINSHNIYIIASNNQLSKLHTLQKKYKFSVIDESLTYKNIEDTLLFS
ncbi:MAG: response regulator [Campylobacterota bacterium]|nr:response regulator [Campylobacterota bacterium]